MSNVMYVFPAHNGVYLHTSERQGSYLDDASFLFIVRHYILCHLQRVIISSIHQRNVLLTSFY